MYPFSIGVMLDSFRTDVNTALDKAQAMGAQGVQVRATSGGDHPCRPHPGKAPGAAESHQGPWPHGVRLVR